MKLFSILFQRFLLLMLAMSASIIVDAHDFEAANEDGVVIYYNIISETEKTCEVTYRGTSYNSYDDEYSGAVKIPETAIGYKVTSIGYSAYKGCFGLTSITIPTSITTIGQEAFNSCRGLNKVIVKDISAWCRIGFKNNYANPLSLAHHLYSDENTEITKLIIPSSVTTIMDYAFYGCTGLTSITIPSSVTTIGQEAFSYCTNLREILINSSPQISTNAFFDDYRISFIYINATTAPYLVNKTFTEDVYQYAYLHIPMGCYVEFSSAYGWRNFNRIKEDLDVNGTTYYTSLRIKQSDLGYVDQYVKVDEEYTVYIAPEGNRRINTVLFNGEDVTEQLVDGYYTTPIIKGRSVLSVSYEEINGVKEIPVSSLKVYGYNGVLYIKDADDNAPLNVYDIDGKLVYNATIANGEATIQLPSSEIYAVKVGERTIKVAL